jgi:hypothetical protein
MSKQQKFPPGWNAKRVNKLIESYDGATEEELATEDTNAVRQQEGQTVISVPDELLPAIRQLLAAHKSA